MIMWLMTLQKNLEIIAILKIWVLLRYPFLFGNSISGRIHQPIPKLKVRMFMNLFCYFFCRNQSDWFKNSWKFRIRTFGIGWWILWARYFKLLLQKRYRFIVWSLECILFISHMEGIVVIRHGIIRHSIILFISIGMLFASDCFFVLVRYPFLFGNFISRAPFLSRLHHLSEISFTCIVDDHDKTDQRNLKEW